MFLQGWKHNRTLEDDGENFREELGSLSSIISVMNLGFFDLLENPFNQSLEQQSNLVLCG